MANANKAKGDRAEAAVRDYVVEFFPESWRTRAGWDEDRGDIVLDLLGDKVLTWAIQVKDVASPSWREWFLQLADQVKAGGHRGGVIWWKLRGRGHPKDWRVVMSGESYLRLMAYVRDLEHHLDGVGADGAGVPMSPGQMDRGVSVCAQGHRMDVAGKRGGMSRGCAQCHRDRQKKRRERMLAMETPEEAAERRAKQARQAREWRARRG